MMNQDLWVFQYVPFDVFSMFILKEEFSNLVVCIILHQFSFIECCFGGKKCSRLFALVRYCSTLIMSSIFVNLFNAISICFLDFWVSWLIVSQCLCYPLILVSFLAYNIILILFAAILFYFIFLVDIDFSDTLTFQIHWCGKQQWLSNVCCLFTTKMEEAITSVGRFLVASSLFPTSIVAYIFQVQFPPTII